MDDVEEAASILKCCRERHGRRTKNKIALIQPRKGGRPALGLLYIGAYLLDNLFEVRAFEFLDDSYPPNQRYNRRLWEGLADFDPDFIGFGALSSYCKTVQRMISRIRRELPGKTIICGGKHATSDPGDFLLHGSDFCVVGEGEIVIVELLDALNFDEPLDRIKGIAYLKDGEVAQTEPRAFLPLDWFLRPAFELVNYRGYIDMRLQSVPGHYLRAGFILASRGCPYRCGFCSQNIKGLFRERSVDDVISEIEWQLKAYKVDAFVLLDDLFYFKEDRTAEFCSKILGKNIRTKFYCHARVDRVSRETVSLMKKAGFMMFAIGVESGSEKILKAMNKKTSPAQIRKAFEIYNSAGIKTLAHIIVGHPEETDEDRRLTRELLEEIRPTHVATNYYMPMPGTPSCDFEVRQAKYLLGGENFEGFTFTHDYPEFSTSIPLGELKSIGDGFERLSTTDRNKNLFAYPGFIGLIATFLLFHPFDLLEALYLRYVVHRTNQMSLFSVLKDAIQSHTLKF